MNREITIAGGGLAGLSLAAALRLHDVPVIVLEAGNYPRHRVCGEFISGVSAETLAALGISETLADSLQHRSLAWFDRGRLLHENQLKTPALGISRFLLDQRLRDHAVELGADVRVGVRVPPEPREGLVWTAGKRPEKSGGWIGLKAHFKIPSRKYDLEMHAGSNGYSGLAGVEDGWTNVCGLFRLDRALRGGDLLTRYIEAGGNPALAAMLRGSEIREGSFSAIAGFQLGRQAEVPGLFTLGDAESLIPPFTGNGMSMAFQAAESAVEPLLAWSRGASDWTATRELVRRSLRRKFRRRLAVSSVLHRFLMADAGRSVLKQLASARMLPFQPMLALIR